MRSATLKWIIFLSTIVVAVIVSVQLYWLNKIYLLEQKQFNTNVVKSIRGLLEDMQLDENAGIQLEKLIEHPDQNTFLIQLDTIPRKDSLLYYLAIELEDFEILADCKVGVFDKNLQKYAFEVYLPTAASHQRFNTGIDLPLIKRSYSYIHLLFPHREKYVLGQLSFWIVATIFLLITLIAFSISLFYLYRQKTLNEVQKDFVNNFTHEFKTPLAVIKLAADVLINPSITSQPDRLMKYGRIVKDQTEHLQYQVERLLKTATSDRQSLQLEKKEILINEIIKDVLHQVDPMIVEKKVKIDLDLDDNDPMIKADRKHIGMVLVNLVENAIKYSTNPHVIIKTNSDNGDYSISVKDNGVGIEKKYIKHLFKRFFRVPTGNVHNVKGFGLGLNFVKKVIDSHHGKIIVNSLPGIGTEFKIVLPKL